MIASSEPGKADDRVKKEKRRRKARKAFIRLILKIAVIAGICFALMNYVFNIAVCHENNMYPMIKDGDLCIAYRLEKYKVGDIVIYPVNDGRRLGRIVATGGHSVDINNEGLIVDGSLQYEKVVYPTSKDGSTVTFPYKVPDNSVFILNDYREEVTDSRVSGDFKIEELEGAVVLVLRRRGI